jgi:hypothetical protein
MCWLQLEIKLEGADIGQVCQLVAVSLLQVDFQSGTGIRNEEGQSKTGNFLGDLELLFTSSSHGLPVPEASQQSLGQGQSKLKLWQGGAYSYGRRVKGSQV